MNFPLDLRFKLVTISSRIAVRDATGQAICFVKQKSFKLKEAVTIFADEAQTRPLYRIDADRMIDISAQYRIDDMTGRTLGVVKRRGMRSIWRAQYEIHRAGAPVMVIQEENPWVKVVDRVMGEIPIVGMLAGYLFHPAFRVTRSDTGAVALRVEKRPAFLENRFRVDAVSALSTEDELLAVLSILMVLLLERLRG